MFLKDFENGSQDGFISGFLFVSLCVKDAVSVLDVGVHRTGLFAQEQSCSGEVASYHCLTPVAGSRCTLLCIATHSSSFSME